MRTNQVHINPDIQNPTIGIPAQPIVPPEISMLCLIRYLLLATTFWRNSRVSAAEPDSVTCYSPVLTGGVGPYGRPCHQPLLVLVEARAAARIRGHALGALRHNETPAGVAAPRISAHCWRTITKGSLAMAAQPQSTLSNTGKPEALYDKL